MLLSSNAEKTALRITSKGKDPSSKFQVDSGECALLSHCYNVKNPNGIHKMGSFIDLLQNNFQYKKYKMYPSKKNHS